MATHYGIPLQNKLIKHSILWGVIPGVVLLGAMMPTLIRYVTTYDPPVANDAGVGAFVWTVTLVATVAYGIVQLALLRLIYGSKLSMIPVAPLVTQQLLSIAFAAVAIWLAALCVSDPYGWGVATAFVLFLIGIPLMMLLGTAMIVCMAVFGKKWHTSAFSMTLLFAVIALLLSFLAGSYFSSLMYVA